ncbi:MAG TPA: permease [Oscillatoriales cyanobacterium M59_W2019_021]|nr:MAG: permease [Cyanobacteria bacterium J055]HIK33894.1 permease [Oscillatoriales cyanobacterium M4454_W2019_049]HIK49924.1 permease [Oscillatoriales cyanobacterium M59_W2019_021]
MKPFNNAFTIFLSLLVEALPFLLLGVLFSSALLLFVNERNLVKRLPKNPVLGAFAGSLVGFLFPVCECGNVPVARRLLVQGVSPAVAVGFLLAAPTINPIVIWSTWAAFRDRPEIVVLRVVFSLVVATVIGVIFSIQGDLRPLLHPNLVRAMPKLRSETPETEEKPALLKSGTYLLGQSGGTLRLDDATASEDILEAIAPDAVIATNASGKQRWQLFVDNTIAELRELGGVLVLGSAIAAFVQVAVPREAILNLGQGPVTSILVMLGLAALVSICSTVDAFFALSFSSAFTSGSLLAFLVFGPTIDLKSIGLLLSIFRTRAVVYLFILAAQLTFFLTLLVNLHWS